MKMRLLIAAAIAWIAAAPPAQTPPATAPFFFLQMSDPQFGMFTKDNDFVQETANFEFAIATANRLKPAFLVITGDLVNKAGDAAQIAEFRRIAARLDRSIPLYNVAGNHDVENTPTPESIASYTAAFGPDHYTFRSRNLVGIRSATESGRNTGSCTGRASRRGRSRIRARRRTRRVPACRIASRQN